MSTPEELKQSLLTKCEKLRRNDPSVTSLDLKKYEKLEWDEASHIAGALANNTRVRELILALNGQRHGLYDTNVALFELESESGIARSHEAQNQPRNKGQP
jgi:hypothetical protein